MEHIRSLDGLRAIAVFLVIISHADWLHIGWVGVQIFFVLSGFLITGILLADKDRHTRVKSFLGRFYRRRTLRIFPLYFFALGAIALIDAAIGVEGFTESIPYLVTYTYNWGHASLSDSPFFVHFWSLSVEEQFYLIWPLLIWMLPRRHFATLTVALIAFGPLVRYGTAMVVPLISGRPDGGMGWFIYFASTSHIDAFAWGAGIALLRKVDVKWLRRPGYYVVGLFILFLALGGVNLLYYYPEVDWSALGYTRRFLATGTHIWGYTVINAFSATLILYLVRHGARLLETTAICYVGQISYGIYVYHYGVWHILDNMLAPKPYTMYGLGCLALAVALTLVISHYSFKWLEQPFLRLKDKDRKAAPLPVLSTSR